MFNLLLICTLVTLYSSIQYPSIKNKYYFYMDKYNSISKDELVDLYNKNDKEITEYIGLCTKYLLFILFSIGPTLVVFLSSNDILRLISGLFFFASMFLIKRDVKTTIKNKSFNNYISIYSILNILKVVVYSIFAFKLF